MEIGQTVVVGEVFRRSILPPDFEAQIIKAEFFFVEESDERRINLPVGMKLEFVASINAFKRKHDEMISVPAGVFRIVKQQTNGQSQLLADQFDGWLMVISEEKQARVLKTAGA